MIFGRKKKNISSNLDSFLNQEGSSAFTNESPATSSQAETNIAVPLPQVPEVKTQTNTILQTKKSLEKKPKKSLFAKNDFHNPEILDLDLVRQASEGTINWHYYINSIIIAASMVCLVVAQSYFIISWWQDNAITSESIIRKTEIAQKEIKVVQKTADDALSFSNRADQITPLLDQHIYWTNFFRYLEKNTLSTVYFPGFSGDTNGSYSFSATANHYSDINWQVKNFLADDNTISASVGAGSSLGGQDPTGALTTSTDPTVIAEAQRMAKEKRSSGPQGVSFSIALKVKPEIFFIKK
ncbi:MAG: hypothetical protein NT165_03825 [Candidatus Falkowbacteria bacterium]|nr:hypothetical protein [Candidatus Falkowbacteria bacterium]